MAVHQRGVGLMEKMDGGRLQSERHGDNTCWYEHSVKPGVGGCFLFFAFFLHWCVAVNR